MGKKIRVDDKWLRCATNGEDIMVSPVALSSGVLVDFCNLLKMIEAAKVWDDFVSNKKIIIICPKTKKECLVQRDLIGVYELMEQVCAQVNGDALKGYRADYFSCSPKVLSFLVQTATDRALVRYVTVVNHFKGGRTSTIRSGMVHAAVTHSKIPTLKALHKLDPSLLEMPNTKGCTPVMHAVLADNVDVLKALHGLDPLLLDEKKIGGVSRLEVAAALNKRVKVFKFLQESNGKSMQKKPHAGTMTALSVGLAGHCFAEVLRSGDSVTLEKTSSEGGSAALGKVVEAATSLTAPDIDSERLRCQRTGAPLIAPVVLPTGVLVDASNLHLLMQGDCKESNSEYATEQPVVMQCPITMKKFELSALDVNICPSALSLCSQYVFDKFSIDSVARWFSSHTKSSMDGFMTTISDEILVRYCKAIYESSAGAKVFLECCLAYLAAAWNMPLTINFLYRVQPSLLGQSYDVYNYATPAQIATEFSHLAVLEALHHLEPGILEARDESTKDTLTYDALCQGNRGVIGFFLKHYRGLFDIPNRNGRTPAMEQAHEGKVSALKTLLELAPDILDTKVKHGFSLNEIAVEARKAGSHCCYVNIERNKPAVLDFFETLDLKLKNIKNGSEGEPKSGMKFFDGSSSPRHQGSGKQAQQSASSLSEGEFDAAKSGAKSGDDVQSQSQGYCSGGPKRPRPAGEQEGGSVRVAGGTSASDNAPEDGVGAVVHQASQTRDSSQGSGPVADPEEPSAKRPRTG